MPRRKARQPAPHHRQRDVKELEVALHAVGLDVPDAHVEGRGPLSEHEPVRRQHELDHRTRPRPRAAAVLDQPSEVAHTLDRGVRDVLQPVEGPPDELLLDRKQRPVAARDPHAGSGGRRPHHAHGRQQLAGRRREDDEVDRVRARVGRERAPVETLAERDVLVDVPRRHVLREAEARQGVELVLVERGLRDRDGAEAAAVADVIHGLRQRVARRPGSAIADPSSISCST